MAKKLFIPGPVSVAPEVLDKLATPIIGHRGKEASELQKSITHKLQKLFFTKEEILLSTSSGSGLMEGAIRSCTGKRAAVFSIGAFGKRWFEMAQSNQVQADLFEQEWGKATSAEQVEQVLKTGKYDLITITHNETSTGVMNPLASIAQAVKKYPDVIFCVDAVSSMGGSKIETDTLGIDICITSTQKSLGLPPGFSVCTFSAKAAARAEKVPFRGYYFDLLSLYDYIKTKDYQYSSTPSLPHMFALDYQLDRILAEGIENRYCRHQEMAEMVREWAVKNYSLFADSDYLSDTVTVINNTRNIDISELNKELGCRGYQIANGYGKMKDKTFRIAHMADYTIEDIANLLKNIDDILN
ncbi:MAG: alanine--glyoxylate aminotransferase family protein [Syntrophomonadaceae bacterium]|jgi:aspartate aminotransferase-like enzyme|nr:alanine--glyoxylate aminotransferase family protein [Syntrophomonadaceae bacterium]